jgi:protein TonB
MSEWVTKRTPVTADAEPAPAGAAPLVMGGALHPSLAPSDGAVSAHAPFHPRRRDPINSLLDESKSGDEAFYAGVGVAVFLHVGLFCVAFAIGLLRDIRNLMQESRGRLIEQFSALYEVDLTQKKAEAAKPPEPPPEPPPPPVAPPPLPAAPKAAAPKPEDPYDQPPPAPAQAAKVLVAKEDPDQPVDLTKNSIVTGEGTALGGQQSADGKGDKITMSPHASHKGVPGGTGTGTAAPAAPPPNLAKQPGLVGGTSWNCPFPPEADSEQIDQAVVTIVVTVRPDGTPLSASVTNDPGHGFGRAARLCAMSRRYTPGLDKTGAPTTMSTPPINVRFSR